MNDYKDMIIIRGRLNGKQRNLLKGLFDMLYTTRELAEEIDISIDQIYRVYVPGGCPCERDSRNHIFINGKLFKEWYEKTYKKQSLNKNQAFCLTCKKPAAIEKKERLIKNGLIYDLVICPYCGRKISKIVDYKRG